MDFLLANVELMATLGRREQTELVKLWRYEYGGDDFDNICSDNVTDAYLERDAECQETLRTNESLESRLRQQLDRVW